MKLFFNILLSILVVSFVLAAGLLLVSSFHPSFFPLDARNVLTGSMEPAIPTGSIVFIYPQESYGEGDIVTFQRADSNLEAPITHRIIAVEEEDGRTKFTTKGDANEVQDLKPMYEDEILGKVIYHVPFVGRMLEAAKTPWGFAALIIIPALLVIADEVKKIIGYLRRGKEEKITEEKPKEEN